MSDQNETPPPSGGGGAWWYPPKWLGAILVFLVSGRFLWLLQFRTPYILGYDGYYHIRYAEMLKSIGIVREFPWAAHSMWATRFADKELLYHVLLIPFTWFGDLARGLKVATVLLGSVAVASFFLVLRLNRFRFALLWSVLLLSSGRYFLFRLGSPRPHVLSLVLLLWIVHCVLNRKRSALAILVFVYCFSYTAFHLAVVVAVIASIQRWIVERQIDWKTPATALAAMLAGMLLNPYFPNNLELFWLQNFVVPWMGITGRSALAMGLEFEPLTTREFLFSQLGVAIPAAIGVYVAVVRPRRLQLVTQQLFVIAGTTILMSCLMKRFVEYSVPLTLLFLAAFLTDQLEGRELRTIFRLPERSRGWLVPAMICLGAGSLFVNSYRAAIVDFDAGPPMRRAAAEYLLEHTEPDELVFTCDWDDVPELFYFNTRNRYPVLLDPNFMYFDDAERWVSWATAAAGGFRGQTYDRLAPDYRFGVCTWDHEELAQIIERDPRMQIVHDTEYTYVFQIDRDNPAISLDDFLELVPD